MRVLRLIGARLAWSVVAVWLSLSGAFFAFALSPDDLQWKRGVGARSAYRRMRNYDQPLFDRYVAWLERYGRLDLGTTVGGAPIDGVLATRLEHTAVYLVPAAVLAVVLAVVAGYGFARRNGTVADTVGTSLVYFWYGVPAFVLAAAIYWISVDHLDWHNVRYSRDHGFYSERNLPTLVPPALILAGNMLAIWLRYARLEFVELLDEEFVKTLRANGAGSGRIFAHLLRNAAGTLLTAVFVEMVSVTVIAVVVVETVLDFPGYGSLVYDAVFAQDIGLIMGAMLVPIGLAVFGNLVQDVVYPILDPRIDFGSEPG